MKTAEFEYLLALIQNRKRVNDTVRQHSLQVFSQSRRQTSDATRSSEKSSTRTVYCIPDELNRRSHAEMRKLVMPVMSIMLIGFLVDQNKINRTISK